MFDEVIVAVDDDEAALDALALGKILASPVAPLTPGESALHLAPLALRLAHHAPCPVLVVAKPVPVASDGW